MTRFIKHAQDLEDAVKIANGETLIHKHNLSVLMTYVVQQLLHRMHTHDLSKLGEQERDAFAIYTPKLAGMQYGSSEYTECLREMEEAIAHHYAHNTHHPEHYSNGISGMSLLDLIEMVLDWKAASLRSKDGNILRSLEMNRSRFDISDQLYSILHNTILELELDEMR